MLLVVMFLDELSDEYYVLARCTNMSSARRALALAVADTGGRLLAIRREQDMDPRLEAVWL